MAMSRTGVSHSWIVELQMNVAHILNHPATKHTATSTARLRVWAQMMLAAMSTAPHIRSPVRAV